MINLLPESRKKDLRAARANTLLVRYISITAVAVIVLGGLIGGTYGVLETSRASAEQAMQDSQASTSKYADVKAEADSLRTDLANAKTILDQKVSYTNLIYGLADAMPAGVIIQQLELDPSTFGSPMTITAYAKDIESASDLETKLSAKKDLFSSVKLLSVESGGDNSGGTGDTVNPTPTGESGASDPAYPVQASISLVINKEAVK